MKNTICIVSLLSSVCFFASSMDNNLHLNNSPNSVKDNRVLNGDILKLSKIDDLKLPNQYLERNQTTKKEEVPNSNIKAVNDDKFFDGNYDAEEMSLVCRKTDERGRKADCEVPKKTDGRGRKADYKVPNVWNSKEYKKFLKTKTSFEEMKKSFLLADEKISIVNNNHLHKLIFFAEDIRYIKKLIRRCPQYLNQFWGPQDHNTLTPLMFAIVSPHYTDEETRFELIKFILEDFDDVNLALTDLYGNSVLHLAALFSRFKVLDFLGRKEFNIRLDWNLVNDSGDTILHMAVASNTPSIVSCVLNKNKALIFTKNSEGLTPLCYAIGNHLFFDKKERRIDAEMARKIINSLVGSVVFNFAPKKYLKKGKKNKNSALCNDEKSSKSMLTLPYSFVSRKYTRDIFAYFEPKKGLEIAKVLRDYVLKTDYIDYEDLCDFVFKKGEANYFKKKKYGK